MGLKKNKWISGVEFYRCKNKVCKAKLIDILGSSTSLQKWSRPDTLLKASNTKRLLEVADCLGVTVDQLFEVHSVAELADGDRPQRQSKYADPGNCMSNYRIRNGLSFELLAGRLGGVSRQYAQEVCQGPRAPMAGIQRICAYEKMTLEEFMRAYGNDEAA